MAKSGFVGKRLVRVIKSNDDSSGWTLCVGSGISYPIFPKWDDLVKKLLVRDIGSKNGDLVKDGLSMFSPDALIEAARDRLALNDREFAQVLVEELYSNALSRWNKRDGDLFLRLMAKDHAGSTPIEDIERFLNLLQEAFPTASILPVARIVVDAIGTDVQPQSILSFNAENLFFTTIVMLLAQRRMKEMEQGNRIRGVPKQVNLITHSTSTRGVKLLPYYMCHGALPVPLVTSRRPSRESVDKLVFSESSYLTLANSSFSWQSAIFLEAASSRHMVFVGTSMTDPNMRRWLGWAHRNRCDELRQRNVTKPSTHHYWIKTDPGRTDVRQWVESSVAHLGIRMVWIESWDAVESTLRTMLGLPKSAG